jgi:opacity protein-like surface antigen
MVRYRAIQTSLQRAKISSFQTPLDKTTLCSGGYTVGAGLDWALTPNIFARGEFEFVQFAPITNIAVSVASGRVGAGFKF